MYRSPSLFLFSLRWYYPDQVIRVYSQTRFARPPRQETSCAQLQKNYASPLGPGVHFLIGLLVRNSPHIRRILIYNLV